MTHLATLYKQLSEFIPPERISTNEPLSKHTYFKIGGPADILIETTTRKELVNAFSQALKLAVPVFILGSGSNILVSDFGIPGLVIKNRADEIKLQKVQGEISAKNLSVSHVLLEVDSGVITNHLVRFSIDQGLSGLEFFLGLPGTVGGAVYNNSHYNQELFGNKIESVSVVNTKGELLTMAKNELDFTYDHSVFHRSGGLIVSATFALTGGDKQYLWEKATQYAKNRSNTQPLSQPSSGCMFKNLTQKQLARSGTGYNVSTGFLIDQAGLKGTRIGDAQVSTIHANFIVNLGQATASDVQALVKAIQQEIKSKYQIRLEPEVFFVGSSEPRQAFVANK